MGNIILKLEMEETPVNVKNLYTAVSCAYNDWSKDSTSETVTESTIILLEAIFNEALKYKKQ